MRVGSQNIYQTERYELDDAISSGQYTPQVSNPFPEGKMRVLEHQALETNPYNQTIRTLSQTSGIPS